ncbi:GDP-mannose 4,6-dehydratase [Salix suchowensis]|nr:GDP-mannose 4,6-dehydratase [Salix suchowensis]
MSAQDAAKSQPLRSSIYPLRRSIRNAKSLLSQVSRGSFRFELIGAWKPWLNGVLDRDNGTGWLISGYQVHGIIRRSSSFNTGRLHHLYEDQHERMSVPSLPPSIITSISSRPNKFKLHYGDLSDSTNLVYIIASVQPTEIYNLGAQSHVKVSFEMAEYTGDVDGLGTLRLLDAVRTCGLQNHVRFYQASTSELYGKVVETPQSETTPSILVVLWVRQVVRILDSGQLSGGVRDVRMQWDTVQPREPRRGRTFVTRKITRAAADISLGKQSCLYLGNLDAQRDWGHARDYVEGMWLMLQQPSASDYVLATGETHPVKEFVGGFWGGRNRDQCRDGQSCRAGGPRYFRPAEVEYVSSTLSSTFTLNVISHSLLLGNPAKAERVLGWKRKVDFDSLVAEMVEADLKSAKSLVEDQN